MGELTKQVVAMAIVAVLLYARTKRITVGFCVVQLVGGITAAEGDPRIPSLYESTVSCSG